MNMSEQLDQVRAIVAEVLEVSAQDVVGDANFVDELGADSLRVIEILSRLEKEFHVSIDQSQLVRMVSLNAVMAVLNDAVATAA